MSQKKVPLETLARHAVEQSPDGIVFADREGIIHLWNGGAVRIFGYSAVEALGHSLNLVVPERFREAHWSGYLRAMADGRTKYAGQAMATRSTRKDGTTVYVELTFAILRDELGNVLGALAHVRDITERYTQERDLRKRVTELEQQVKALREDSSSAGHAR